MSPPTREFTVGALAFRLDPDTGMSRRIRFHGHEIVRGIYTAVRDQNWATLPSGVGPIEIEESEKTTTARVAARVMAGPSDAHPGRSDAIHD